MTKPYDICIQRYETTIVDGVEDAECTLQYNLKFNDIETFSRDEQARPIELYCEPVDDSETNIGITIDLTIEAAERIRDGLNEILDSEREAEYLDELADIGETK